jgi:hypothetical protein
MTGLEFRHMTIPCFNTKVPLHSLQFENVLLRSDSYVTL